MSSQEIPSSDQAILKSISAKFTTQTLHDILIKATGHQEIVVEGWNLGGSNKKGDSYLSTLFRMNVIGSIKNGSEKIVVPLIIKGLPANIARRKTYRSTDFFATEIAFYDTVWPKLSQFLKEKNIKTPFLKIPECYACLADGENDYVVLEDVTPLGHACVLRQTGLDYNHCKIVMTIFAKLHSLSLAFKDQNPKEHQQIVAALKETYFSEDLRKWYQTFYKNLCQMWLETVQEDLPGTIYETKFKTLLANDFHGQLIKIAGAQGPLSVVSHGDTWVPNFLMKYNSADLPTSAYLIDFQLARTSSPALDITFFLYACTDQELRKNHWDDLMCVYYEVFTSSLVELGSSPDLLTMEKLQQELIQYGRFGLGMSLEAVPFSMASDNETADLDSIEGTDAVDIATVWIVKPIEPKLNRKRMMDIIIDVVDRGFI